MKDYKTCYQSYQYHLLTLSHHSVTRHFHFSLSSKHTLAMMRTLTFIISLLSIVQSSKLSLDSGLGKCLSDLATQELSNSYNYLQLSSKFGATNAYPGFSSLYVKLSDDDFSKSHDLVKFLALRKYKSDRLINTNGVGIRNEISTTIDIYHGLTQTANQNKLALQTIDRCHRTAGNVGDANVQDYLESHHLDHHIEVDKLLSDFDHRLSSVQGSDKNLITFMLDEELLNTYGDRRKDIFS